MSECVLKLSHPAVRDQVRQNVELPVVKRTMHGAAQAHRAVRVVAPTHATGPQVRLIYLRAPGDQARRLRLSLNR